MNERETKLAQIEQNQADRHRLIDEGEKLQDELVELNKTKIKHWDYGFTKICSEPRLCVDEDMLNESGQAMGFARYSHDYVIIGNIFDDLKRNNEDLEEFKADVHTYKFNFKECPHAPIYIAGNWHPMHEAVEIHQKLGQLIATAKRRAK